MLVKVRDDYALDWGIGIEKVLTRFALRLL